METELERYQQQSIEGVDKAERKVRVERLVKPSEEAMIKASGNHEQLYSLADKTTDPEALKNVLKSWLSDVTVENEVLKQAGEYIDGLLETELTSQSSVNTNQKPTSAFLTFKTPVS